MSRATILIVEDSPDIAQPLADAFRFVYRCNGMPEWSSALTPLNGTSNTPSPFVALATRGFT